MYRHFLLQKMKIKLLPIDEDEKLNKHFTHETECVKILKVYPEFYKKFGYNKPWIGYFVSNNIGQFIGSCGYKGAPKNGKIEIAYGTFKKFKRKGIGTEICRLMILLALKTNPKIKITARTLSDNAPSIKILEKNQFKFSGMVMDDEDGEVCEWEYVA